MSMNAAILIFNKIFQFCKTFIKKKTTTKKPSVDMNMLFLYVSLLIVYKQKTMFQMCFIYFFLHI